MTKHTITMPDVGEGIAEAEVTEWAVEIGDVVKEDDILATVMTDKAAVEIPSTVTGEVVWLGGETGDIIAVGSKLIQIEAEGVDEDDQESEEPEALKSKPAQKLEVTKPKQTLSQKPLAAPPVRKRAKDLDLDLSTIKGTGPEGRITHKDLDHYLQREHAKNQGDIGITEIKVIGLRRKIAEKMSLSNQHIPHISIVEEVDVTALEELREELNKNPPNEEAKLTILPFMMRAIVTAMADHPEINAHYNDETEIITQYQSIHLGIATQTPNGLLVPVINEAERLDIWQCAIEAKQLTDRARAGKAERNELTGSTITITSLGALGGIATTPIINHPEVAIVGINKITTRPVWQKDQFEPRKIMNISCSFDHRVIDGWNAAHFMQKLKQRLEEPVGLT